MFYLCHCVSRWCDGRVCATELTVHWVVSFHHWSCCCPRACNILTSSRGCCWGSEKLHIRWGSIQSKSDHLPDCFFFFFFILVNIIDNRIYTGGFIENKIKMTCFASHIHLFTQIFIQQFILCTSELLLPCIHTYTQFKLLRPVKNTQSF